MTRTDAVRAAKKRWGTHAVLRAGDQLTSPERRAAAGEALLAAKAERERRTAELDARLAATPWYVEARAELARLAQIIKTSAPERYHYRFTVGRRLDSLGWETRGHGDTWEEAFAEADARAAREAEARSARQEAQP